VKSIRKCCLVSVSLALLLTCFWSSKAFALDPTFMRNGEAYLSIGAANGQIMEGIYRLSDPEGALGGTYPKFLFKEDEIRNFAVDINRNVFTLSDPKASAIGAGFMLKRQVLDNTGVLGISPKEGKFSTTGVTSESPPAISGNVTEVLADWGYHAFIHADHRGSASHGNTLNANVYRTMDSTRGANATRYAFRNWSGSSTWTRFYCLQGKETTAPASPREYLPHFGSSNQNLVLPHYTGKKWYEIPNGAWYSSWRAKAGTTSHYYQCYRDFATGTQKEWRLVEFNPTNALSTNYTRKARAPFATTYEMHFARSVLAGCLDGCGGSSGSAKTSGSTMTFDAAFMPFSNAGKPDVTVYSYSRTDGTGNYSLDYQKGSRTFTMKTFGSGAGVGKNDTRWIGASKGPTASSGTECDYVYFLGTSQIQSWIPQISNQNITAVSVSNQWNEEGGIIFAFNKTDNQIIKFKLHPISGALADYTTINVSNLMTSMKANSTIDDIAADGFGNLYISLTYPSSNPSYDVPKAFGWTYNDAHNYAKVGEADTGESDIRFYFKIDYRKSVRKVSAMGEPLEEVGAAKIATREYYRDVTIPTGRISELPAKATMPNNNMEAIVKDMRIRESNFIASSMAPITATSKLAIINAPTPPEVKTLGGNRSYLDIIGAYDQYPTPDKLNHSTRQDQQPRRSRTNLNLSTLYYFMVENYPLPEAVQNPNVNADYDKDGRRSGFVSSIIDAEPSAGKIRYIWNLWMVRDHQGNPCVPPNPSNPDNSTSSYFSVFYSPIPARYVLTCKVEYDWYDYNTVKFGQTIKDWEKDFAKNGGKKTSWAFASAEGLDASGYPIVANSSNRLTTILNELFADYKGTDKASAISSIHSSIMAQDKKLFKATDAYTDYYLAMEGVVATGTTAPSEDPTEVARVQRCNPPSSKVTAAGNWHPTGNGIMDPKEGYHGIAAEQTYYWRLDVASQSIFFEDLTKADAYKYLADKLTNKDEKAYFVNAKSDFRFVRNGSDLRWDGKSELGLEATLRYPTANKSGYETYPLTGEVKEGTEGGKKFRYFELKAGTLPPTDPYVGELSIKLNRMFYYDMYVFDDKGNQLMKNPITLPKMLTIEGKTNVMVIDSTPPRLVFSETKPNQLYGETGKKLTTAGNGQSADKLSFIMSDNNPWEAISSVTPHKDFKNTNIAYNKTRIANITNENASFNLKPVFNNVNRFFRVFYEVSDDDAKKKSESKYIPGWGIDPDTITADRPQGTALKGITATSDLIEDTTAYNKLYTELNLLLPFDKLGENGAIRIPSNYANNTPGYGPLKFYFEGSDSSGNRIPRRDLNVVLHVRDTLRPMPYGEIVEYKYNNIAYIPGVELDMSASAKMQRIPTWYQDFKDATRKHDTVYDKEDDNKALWTADAQTGKIGLYGNKELYALPYLNASDNVVSLTKTKFNAKIAPMVASITPGNISVEDNVEVVIKAGAIDNAGGAMSKLTVKHFDLNGSQKTATVNYPSSWTEEGVKYESTQVDPNRAVRLVFREHVAITGADGKKEAQTDFPLGIPIIIEAKDNAKTWDTYPDAKHNDNDFEWGELKDGIINSNIRTFKTTLPVYGTRLEIRTIDKYRSK
jgi:hypothetical protein